jgi:hypothetical protein
VRIPTLPEWLVVALIILLAVSGVQLLRTEVFIDANGRPLMDRCECGKRAWIMRDGYFECINCGRILRWGPVRSSHAAPPERAG